MHIAITGKNFDIGEAFHSYIENAIGALVEKHFSQTHDIQVRLAKEAHLYVVDVTIHIARGMILQAHASASDPYPAFDMAAEKIGKRVSRYKGRLRDAHKHAEPAGTAGGEFVINPESEEQWEDPKGQPLIIAEMQTRIDTLSVGEAVMRMDIGDLPALLFTNRQSGDINMVYRRKDGNISWVDPANVKAAALA